MIFRKDTNSFDLVGDGDDVDVVEAIESAFEITISNEEAESTITMGDLFDLIVRKLNIDESPRQVCLTAVTFYRLRQALSRCGYSDGLTPHSDLNVLFRRSSTRRVWKLLASESNLELPYLGYARVSLVALSVLLFISVSCALILHSFYPVGVGLVLALGLSFVLPQSVQRPYESLGELSRAVIALNFGKLSRQYEQYHGDDIWRSAVDVVQMCTGHVHNGPVDRSTRFFA